MSISMVCKSHLITYDVEVERVQEITDLVNRAYWNQQKVYLEEDPRSLRTSEKEIKELIMDPKKRFFVAIAEKTNRIVGTILYDRDFSEKAASFGLFSVDPKYQGQGIGEQLIEVVERQALEDGKMAISIEIFSLAERLVTYYNRHGYKTTGVTHPFTAKLKPSYESQGFFLEANKPIRGD